MGAFIFILFGTTVIIVLYKIISTSSFKANNEVFEQAGVRVIFNTGKIIIRGRTYDVKDIQGISSRANSKFAMEVSIKVDDFNNPIHKVIISGLDNAGEKFIQRLSTALRKAGGHDFY